MKGLKDIMAHKSIATQILEDLRKEQSQELEKEKDICLKFMQKNFNSRLTSFEKMKSDTDYGFTETIPIPFNDLAHVAKLLGFEIKVKSINIFFVVPARKKGIKATPAQAMLENHNISVNQKIKERDKNVQEEISHIWESIKGRDFTSKDNKDGTFTLTIPLPEERVGKYGDERLLKFLSDRAFPNASIENNKLYIVLGEKEK